MPNEQHRPSPRKYTDDFRAKVRRRYLILRSLNYTNLTGTITRLMVEFNLDRNAVHYLLLQEGLRR